MRLVIKPVGRHSSSTLGRHCDRSAFWSQASTRHSWLVIIKNSFQTHYMPMPVRTGSANMCRFCMALLRIRMNTSVKLLNAIARRNMETKITRWTSVYRNSSISLTGIGWRVPNVRMSYDGDNLNISSLIFRQANNIIQNYINNYVNTHCLHYPYLYDYWP